MAIARRQKTAIQDHASNTALVAFAELWKKWTPDSGEPIETFTIITTAASKLVSEVHNRMPVIIARPITSSG